MKSREELKEQMAKDAGFHSFADLLHCIHHDFEFIEFYMDVFSLMRSHQALDLAAERIDKIDSWSPIMDAVFVITELKEEI